jgi:hypothetical protein
MSIVFGGPDFFSPAPALPNKPSANPGTAGFLTSGEAALGQSDIKRAIVKSRAKRRRV